MAKFKAPHKTLQAWESILKVAHERGTLPKDLSSKLRARGLSLPTPPEPLPNWEVVVEPNMVPPPPTPPLIVDETPAEDSCVDQETIDPGLSEASPYVEEEVESPADDAPLPDHKDQKVYEDVVQEDGVEVAGRAIEEQEERYWEREGYGTCIGCADIFILRCNGDRSPWVEGSDKPEEKDGKFWIECGDCQRREGRPKKMQRTGGFGGFGSAFDDVDAKVGHHASFRQIGLNPKTILRSDGAIIADVMRKREVPFVTLQGGTAFLDIMELLQNLPKGAEVGRILTDRYWQGYRTELVSRSIGGLM